ncbi:hypothetical protein [Streptomyces sp. NPDC016675]|uniref:hypothetical protein n=1 Tax=Streptomyces sp. NPDC016675 TaxID=3364970 RepID=UPI0036FAFEC0
MKKKLGAAIATIAALAATAISAAPANASEYVACSTTGASGSISITNWSNPGANVGISIDLTDTSSDGHHVQIRVISQQYDGKRVNWSWRKNTSGAGTTKEWSTTAYDDRGLHEMGVQVARFEGGTMLNSCTKWA